MSKDLLADFDFLAKLIVGIGEVAKITGVPARQLRYWEEKGIIQSLADEDSSTRRYDYLQIKKILLIKELMDEGYTLEAADKKTTDRIAHFNKTFSKFKKSGK